MAHHRLAFVTLGAAALLGVLDGWLFSLVQHIAFWHGLYCIWMTAITVGGDVTPVGWGYACLAFAPVPLIAAAFSLFTSALGDIHLKRSEKRIMEHVSAEHEATREAAA